MEEFLQCNKPFSLQLKNRVPSKIITVPCGHCQACLDNRSRAWALRLWHEYPRHDRACWLTVTYDNKHMPDPMSLRKVDLQLFFKRVRKYLYDCGENRKIKYYACGEYGEKYNRPHYHIIIFGIGLQDCGTDIYNIVTCGVFKECWDKGNIKIGSVTFESCRYTAQYMKPSYYGEEADKWFKDKEMEKPFSLSSQGFGLDFALENEKQIKENLNCSIFGQVCAIPRYYRKKLGIGAESYEAYISDKIIFDKIKYAKKGIVNDYEREREIDKGRKQREATLQARKEIYNSRKNNQF